MTKSSKDPKTLFDKYLSTYSGRRLLETHTLTEIGVWRVRGEGTEHPF